MKATSKLISVVLVLAMCLSLVATSAFADSVIILGTDNLGEDSSETVSGGATVGFGGYDGTDGTVEQSVTPAAVSNAGSGASAVTLVNAGAGYASLADALAAAGADETVKLNQNASISGSLTVNKSVTIDLNGNALSFSNSGAAADAAIIVTGGSVTVKNGAFTADPEVKLYAIGDVNNDKAVNMLDITAIKRHLIKVERLDEYKAICADVNNDDIVNTLDILALKRHLIKVEPLWQPV